MVQQILRDEVSIASTPFSEYLENQVAEESVSEFGFVHQAFQGFASSAAAEISEAQKTKFTTELEQGRIFAEAKEKLTRKGEFAKFLQTVPINRSDIRRAMRFYEVFGGWTIEKIVVIASATNIFSLLAKSYAEVVEVLRETVVVTKELVQGLVREARDRLKLERQQKKQEATAEWQQDLSGGGRHYAINLYDEQAAMKVQRLAEEQQVLPHRVIVEAIAAYGEPAASSEYSLLERQIEEMRRLHQQEIASVISEVREKHIELQQELFKRDRLLEERECRIAELEAELMQAKGSVSFEGLEKAKESSDMQEEPQERKPQFAVGDVVRHHKVLTWVYQVVSYHGNGEYKVKKFLGNKLENYTTTMMEEHLVPLG